MSLPRIAVSQRLRELLSYDKLAGAVPRVLILESRYWLDGACIHAGRGLGWEIETTPVHTEGLMPREQVQRMVRAVVEFKPDFVLTVNLSGMDCDGLFARLFEDLRIPYVTWFVDDPRTIVMDSRAFASEYVVALTWDAAYTEYLSDVGFPEVQYLPLAVDDTVFNAGPSETWDLPPTFVGNSMIAFAQREWAWVDEHPALAAAIRDAFEAGLVTRERFGQGLGALLSADLLASLDPDEKRHAELLFFVEGTRRLRESLVRILGPEGLEVRGDGGWRSIAPAAGGEVDYAHALPQLYRSCEINLNTTSIQMPTTVNQRVFDCPAAGGFLLTDAQPALAEFFDMDKEVVCYGSAEECREFYRWYRAHPNAKRPIVERARKRVMGEHTYAHRLRDVVALVKGRFCT